MSPQKTSLSGSRSPRRSAVNHADVETSHSRIPRMQGGSEVTLSAHATLTSTTSKQVWARPPIDVDFQVLMFTASGLIVRFLKVFEKSNYQSVKWVRYLTKASGSYQVRVSGSVLSLGEVGFVLIDLSFGCSSESDIYARISFVISSDIYRCLRAPSVGTPSIPRTLSRCES